MSSSAKLSSTSIAPMQTARRDGSGERTRHVTCPRSQGDPVLHRPSDYACFVDVMDERSCDRSERRSGMPLSLPRASIGELMTRNVVSVRPDLCLENAATVFIETDFEALPVVDARGHLLGFVDASAVLHEARAGSRARRTTVRDLMTPRALALPESACITQAAALMAFEGQPRLAVIARTGEIVGVLSAGDVLYWVARADGHVLARPPGR